MNLKMFEILNEGEVKIVNVDGQNLGFEIWKGSKEAKNRAWFLHGWGGNSTSWDKCFDAIKSQVYEGIRLDFPGFGRSVPLKKVMNVENYARLTLKWIKNFEDFSGEEWLFLHSFGGRVFLKMLEIDRDFVNLKFKKVVILAAAGIKHKDFGMKNIVKKIAKIIGLGLKNLNFENHRLGKIVIGLGRKLVGASDYNATNGLLRESFALIVEEDLSKNLEKIQADCWIFWGKKDKHVPYSDAKLWKCGKENRKIILYGDIGHSIHKSEVFCKRILKILKEKNKV